MSVQLVDYIVDEHHIDIDSDRLRKVKVSQVFLLPYECIDIKLFIHDSSKLLFYHHVPTNRTRNWKLDICLIAYFVS